MPPFPAKKLPPVYLKSIYLRNFRNYVEAEANFSPGLNVFYGDNAQGKTNLLEAIYLLATGRSFRTEHLTELVREGETFFFLGAEIVHGGITQTVKLSFEGQNRKLQLNANHYTSFHPLLGLLPSVLYTPYDMELINGTPLERRRFLNLHLAQSDPVYVHHLTRYWRALKQRNCLLKTKKTEHLDLWEYEMAQSASYLSNARQEMIDELKSPLELQSKHLSSEKEKHTLQLLLSQSKNYLQQLQKNRPRELELGFTLAGPHRDDLSLLIDNKPAKTFASEGQKKTAIAALRFAEWERLCKRTEGKALMGIDDLGLHLDDTRLQTLKNRLDQLGQVFLTTPNRFDQGHHIHIQNGNFEK
jgi:DNA replication and repair protein RecF